MIRIAAHMFTVILILSVMLGVGVSTGDHKRTGRALARAGATEVTMWSSGGAETVLLDRDGNKTDPQRPQECAHCAESSLVPLAALFALHSERLTVARGKPRFMILTVSTERSLLIWQPFRGLPARARFET